MLHTSGFLTQMNNLRGITQFKGKNTHCLFSLANYIYQHFTMGAGGDWGKEV